MKIHEDPDIKNVPEGNTYRQSYTSVKAPASGPDNNGIDKKIDPITPDIVFVTLKYS